MLLEDGVGKARLTNHVFQMDHKGPFFVKKPMGTRINEVTDAVVLGWVRKFVGQQWSVISLDAMNFLEVTWAIDKNKIATKRHGISKDQTLLNLDQKLKVALNTLGIVEYIPDFTNYESMAAICALCDLTLVVPQIKPNEIDWPPGTYTYPS